MYVYLHVLKDSMHTVKNANLANHLANLAPEILLTAQIASMGFNSTIQLQHVAESRSVTTENLKGMWEDVKEFAMLINVSISKLAYPFALLAIKITGMEDASK